MNALSKHIFEQANFAFPVEKQNMHAEGRNNIKIYTNMSFIKHVSPG